MYWMLLMSKLLDLGIFSSTAEVPGFPEYQLPD
jgi:hypothetical protein